MSFMDDIAADAAAIINSDGPTESITYTPPSGAARTIYAIVTRDQQIAANGQVLPGVRIGVRNHATYGVSSAEASRGGKFTIPRRYGHAETIDLLITEASRDGESPGLIHFLFEA